jgi:hypothetical protein
MHLPATHHKSDPPPLICTCVPCAVFCTSTQLGGGGRCCSGRGWDRTWGVGTELERGDGTELEGAGTELEGGWDRTVNVEYSHSFLRTVRLLFVILMLEMYSRFFDPIEVTHPRVTIYESIDIIQVQDSPTFVLA